ncbi:hypothetical protein Q3O60_06555 [Alkalimonas collagenimarina]|uniref:Uncharacterized protein n=1 Tax=Alkalimonas collagenimarina TaxID=400390 RepID=A0ABT9GXR8_9GAMM|nr:hypothetical protein [Alkalimonas collagenimarina]MDP4535841.1 hypothetical protein [Alkalimonas collagenimarina]
MSLKSFNKIFATIMRVKLQSTLATLLCWSCLLMGMSVSCATEVQWHGFVAQGAIQAEKSNFINQTGDPSLALTEVGVNALIQLNPRWRVAGQVVYLDGGNRYPDGLKLDYLFVDWTLVNQLDWQLNLYIGRYKNQHWIYSSTRDVPLTRPSIVLPQSVYFDAFRDIAVSSDGLALKTRLDNRLGHFELNWSLGSTPLSRTQTKLLLGEQVQGQSKQKYVHQASAFWQPTETNWTVGLSLLDSEFSYYTSAMDIMFDGDFVVQRLMLNAHYVQARWQLISEVFQERMDTVGFFEPQFSLQQFGQGGYVQGLYQLNTRTKLQATLDYYVVNKDDRRGQQLMASTGGMVPAYFGYQHSASVGISFELADRLRLQAEHHWVEGTGRLAPTVLPDLQTNTHQYWQLWALQLMYWF